jgi:hypothetical protein
MNRTIRVFFASPGDLEEERLLTADTLPEMSQQSGHTFEFLGFESALATTGRRSQDTINILVDKCDVFLAVFYRRWGQPSRDTVAATSYTEEEFERAKRRLAATGAPEIFCFFKQVDLASVADPGEQLSKVLEFKRRIEGSQEILYRPFATATKFIPLLKEHLLAFAENKLPAPRTPARRIHIPIIADQQPESQQSYELAMMRQANSAAASGHVEEASLIVAAVSQRTRSIEILDTIKRFYEEAGNLDAAQAVLERKLTLLHDRRLAAHEYGAALMQENWFDDLLIGMLKQVPLKKRAAAEQAMRKVFDGPRFHELLIELIAEHFTVGEISSLARFYKGEGASISAKFGRCMGIALPQMEAVLATEYPELFK